MTLRANHHKDTSMDSRLFRILIGVLLAGTLLSACGSPAATQTAAATVPVDFYLTFQPDIQFAPMYVGLEKGFFTNHGLDVKITHTSDSDAIRLVGTEKPQSGMHAAIVGAEQVLLARAQGIPVR